MHMYISHMAWHVARGGPALSPADVHRMPIRCGGRCRSPATGASSMKPARARVCHREAVRVCVCHRVWHTKAGDRGCFGFGGAGARAYSTVWYNMPCLGTHYLADGEMFRYQLHPMNTLVNGWA